MSRTNQQFCAACKQNKDFGDFKEEYVTKSKRGFLPSYALCKVCAVLTKDCGKCGHNLLLEHFTSSKLTRTRSGAWSKTQCKACTKNANIRRLYGINIKEYEAMLAKQNNACAICTIKLKGEKDTHVDHNHKTSKVCALLCLHCNTGIGMFREESRISFRAIMYLMDHNDDFHVDDCVVNQLQQKIAKLKLNDDE